MRALLVFWAAAALASAADIQKRAVAVTIDDLPAAQSGPQVCEPAALRALTARLLAPIRERRVPVTAFVIGRNCASLPPAERRAVLQMWRDAGAELGNHTYSHRDLNTMPAEEFESDIARGEASLRETLGVEHIGWFRFPMLHTGPDAATKQHVQAFLDAHQWRQAPVTFDNSDWMFAYAFTDPSLAPRVRAEYVPYLESVIAFFERRSVEVVGREFPQVLLLHANLLNGEMLGSILDMLERRGYRFVSLSEAMRDTAYTLPENYAGKGGFSWIHRWSMTKKMPNKGEPDEPKWLQDAWQKTTAAAAR